MDIHISLHPIRYIRYKINVLITKWLKRHLKTRFVTFGGKWIGKGKKIYDIVPPTDTHLGVAIVFGCFWRYSYEP
jgi:hypothetical protein